MDVSDELKQAGADDAAAATGAVPAQEEWTLFTAGGPHTVMVSEEEANQYAQVLAKGGVLSISGPDGRVMARVWGPGWMMRGVPRVVQPMPSQLVAPAGRTNMKGPRR